MITLEQSADQFSLHIKRGSEHVGYLQWHPDRPPRIVLLDDFGELSVSEVWCCLWELNRRGHFHPPQDQPMRPREDWE